MSASVTRIRDARTGDAAALSALAGQLGYPADAPALVRRLSLIADNDPGAALVAVDADDTVCGFARAVPQHFVTEEPFAELAALIVDEAVRGHDVGRALLAAVEAWARERGFAEVRVRANVIRVRAHHFYQREGYAEYKRQAVLAKRL